jgi:uncharacterized protein
MKVSRFNVLVQESDCNQLVYNTLTGSIGRVNPRLTAMLKSKDLSKLESVEFAEVVEDLKEQGVLVPSEMDELKEYEMMHKKWKEGKESVEFNALLTYDCNFECPYCYQGRGEKGEQIHGFKYMTPELLGAFEKFIKKTTVERGAKGLELVLYGGEPSLPKAKAMGMELTDKVANWARERGILFGLHALSNGSLIDKDFVDWLSNYGARLQIPVDGAPEMHNKYRFYKENSKGSFEDIAKVLGMTRGTDVETHIRISLTDETAPTMEKLLDELKARDLTHVYPDFCYITAFTNACADFKDHTLSDGNLFEIMPNLWREAHKRGFPLSIRPRVQPLPCSSVADGSFIFDPFGEVYKCWELVGLKEHVVGRIDSEGNLSKTSVYGDVLERNPVNIEQCRNHAYLPACAGGCVCKAQWQSNTYHAPGCGSEKYLLKDKIKVYVETLELPNTPQKDIKGVAFQKIEGRQQPKMSHCYVLV